MMELPYYGDKARVVNWESALTLFLLDTWRTSKRGELGFAWSPVKAGEELSPDAQYHSCLSFTGKAVETVIGIDYYDQIVGSKLQAANSAIAVYRELKGAGFNNLEEALCKIFDPLPKIFIQKGDLVLFKASEQALLTTIELGEDSISPADIPAEDMANYRIGVGVADPPYFWGFRGDELGRHRLADAYIALGIGSRPEMGK